MAFSNTSEQAKRLIFEAPDNTKKVLVILSAAFLALVVLLGLSYLGTGSSWTCELDSTDPKHNYICSELRVATSCRSLTGPIKAEILLDINSEVKASALVVCPWENAISELRLCFVLASMFTVLLGMLALSNESRKQAELHSNAAYFFALLLLISSTFDLFAIGDSSTNNYSLCTLTEEFQLEEGITGEQLACSYGLYSLTAYAGYLAAGLLLFAGLQVKEWRSTISLDGI